MIYEAIEKFRVQSGLIPSLDTHDNGTSQCVLLNFDSVKNQDDAGGYISLRLDDGFVYVECFNSCGDIFSELSIPVSTFKPARG